MIVDKLFSFIFIILLSPVFILVSIIIYIDVGHPIIYKQERIGKKGISFKIYKFRTMKNISDKKGNLLSDNIRLTKIGGLIRSLSIDELPELFNILSGNMSFTGPRPLLPKYIPLYSVEQAKRHEVMPGLTGWAQVNGRNNTSWERRLSLDTWYVENYSFLLDCKILALTIFKVIARRDITPKNSSIMPEFKGNQK